MNGIYIHTPFCRNKCDYCSFYSIPVHDAGVMDSFIEQLISEISLITENAGKVEVDTVYFGGGTPSMMQPSQIKKIISHISKRFIIKHGSEITLEMNPDDLYEEKLAGFTNAGINRIVLGVQSFNDDLRERIGRRGIRVTDSMLELFFKSKEFIHCIDIMAGLPGQNKTSLLKDLEKLICYMPEHISLYLLSVDDGTPLYKRLVKDESFDDVQAKLWGEAIDFLTAKGYIHYEISNYALPGFESRHNSKYWDFTPYFGFGPGAHSFINGKRYSNSMTAEEYINAGEFNYYYDSKSEEGTIAEFIMTSLRRIRGFSIEEFLNVTGKIPDEIMMSELVRLQNEGLVEFLDGRYCLSKKGIFFADSVIYRLAEHFL